MTDDFPFARAVLRDGTLTLHRWMPQLITGGPAAGALDRVEATLLDLTRLPEDELLVALVTPTELRPGDEDALLRWAHAVGYRRVWLPDAVAEIDQSLPVLDRAHVRCRGCGAAWDDGRLEFWETVRERGSFPRGCLACGGTLPQWEPRSAAEGRTSRAHT